MRGILLLSGWLFTFSMSAQDVPLTFSVDMNNEEISPSGVHVAGNFQAAAGFPADWNPGSSELTDIDGDGIFELTVNVPAGTYLYKFINGSTWNDAPESPPAACALNDGGGNFNRQVTVGEDGITLPTVVFNACNAVINFSINMTDEVLSPEGVFVTGDFLQAAGYGENWSEPGLAMNDLNADGTYNVSVQLPAGNYTYLFSNGTVQESFSGTCVNDEGQRSLAATVGSFPVPTYCFNTCNICDPTLNDDYEVHWWNDAVFYEIFVRSFYDSDGDGIGDFQGIIEKLDYLNDGDPETTDDLGITGIWLMPMKPSPSYHGYDVTDYYGVEPDYGTMEDFQEFLDAAHARGIRVIIDYVMNHSSSEHPWFIQSRNNQNDFRDWYVWSQTNPGAIGPWGQNLWHFANGSYYYGIFWGGMPDLNYNHPPVREEMMEIAQYWMDLSVDGFRLDAIKYLVEDGEIIEDTPETFEILEELKDVVIAADDEAILVGEVWSNTAAITPYVGTNLLDICFEFSLAESILNAVNNNAPGSFYAQLATVQASYPKLQYGTFLTNHDIDRVFDQLGNDMAKMKQAAAICLTLPGVPFIYYGEEIGMQGTGADPIKRRPMQWSASANGGFTSGTPWSTLGNNFSTNNVAVMEEEPTSLLNFYKKLVHLRNGLAPLRRGYALPLYGNGAEVLHFIRVYEGEAVATVINLGNTPASVSMNLPISTLAEGNYVVTDMLEETVLEDLQIGSNGSFSDWMPTAEIAASEVKVFAIGANSPLAVTRAAKYEPRVNLYPNPSSGIIQLESAEVEFEGNYRIFDTSGRQVKSGPARGQNLTVDINSLQHGIFFIQVDTNRGAVVKRFVVY